MDKLMIKIVTNSKQNKTNKNTKTVLITFSEVNIANRFVYNTDDLQDCLKIV